MLLLDSSYCCLKLHQDQGLKAERSPIEAQGKPNLTYVRLLFSPILVVSKSVVSDVENTIFRSNKCLVRFR